MQLKKHNLEEHDEGWIICEDHCGKKFRSQKNLDSHVKRIQERQKQIYTFQSECGLPFGESVKSPLNLSVEQGQQSFKSISSLESNEDFDQKFLVLEQPPSKKQKIEDDGVKPVIDIEQVKSEVKRRNSADLSSFNVCSNVNIISPTIKLDLDNDKKDSVVQL